MEQKKYLSYLASERLERKEKRVELEQQQAKKRNTAHHYKIS
ncbi:MAG: hypothetical protein O6852_03690 [Gammaproteobacteria bacterium]|nr:hypothetical protein [Gammaproteobacteria bacterium]